MQGRVEPTKQFRLLFRQICAAPERAFLVLGLTFGLLFMLVLPPFQVPDEPAHLYRGYQVTEGRIVAERHNSAAGGWLPQSLLETVNIWTGRIPFRPEEKVDGQQFQSTQTLPLNKDNLTFVPFMSSAYSPVPYLPQAVGITFGKWLNLPPLFILYLGRFTNFIVATLITFFAIKIIPGFKWLFFLLALTPMAVNQRASLSADALLNSVAFLLIAIIMNFVCNPKVEKVLTRDVVMMVGLGTLLALSKQVYFLIPFLYFLIPQAKMGGRKRYWISGITVALCSTLAWVIWSNIMKAHVGIPVNPLVDASVERQTQYLLENPLTIVSTAWNTLQTLGSAIESFIGLLGWLDTKLPALVTLTYPFILVLVALVSQRPDFVITPAHKWKILVICAATVFLIYLSQYLIWMPVGATIVDAVQGRYLIPIAPLFFFLFYNQRWSFRVSELTGRTLLVSYSLVVLTASLVAVIARFY
ncbi:DUF2142 domain-containing protein [Pantanalinema rosaneae CENA516]|uniref:DUF2142 domain-containing protein n=1 Tax=Pantanalinema rosaneae TaxID=1620701 RepID=UPI003D6E76E0